MTLSYSDSDAESLGEVIEVVYSAALHDELWGTVLEKICRLIGTDVSFITLINLLPQPHLVEGRCGGRIVVDWKTYSDMLHLDPKLPYYSVIPANRAFADYDFLSEKLIDDSLFYQKLFFPQGLRYMVGSKLQSPEGKLACFSAVRTAEQGPVGPREKALVTEISRHVSQALSISGRIANVKKLNHNLYTALNYIPDPVLIVNPDATIVELNSSAEALLRGKSGLKKWRQSLIAEHPATTRLLHDLIASAAKREPGTMAGKATSVPRKNGGQPLQALALPLTSIERAMLNSSDLGQPMIMLVISDPENTIHAESKRLQDLFGFTPAEARMAAALAAGASVASYSASAKITVQTARWTLKQIFAKSGCGRQSELVKLVSSLSATAAAMQMPSQNEIGASNAVHQSRNTI